MRTMQDIFIAAKTASREAATLTSERKNTALLAMADFLETGVNEILQANATDLENAKGVLPDVMLDRLRLDKDRVFAMAKGIRDVALLPDPVGVFL